MNKARAAKIAKLAASLQEVHSILEELRDEEQSAYDNMPESLQSSDRGQATEAAAGELDNATSSLQDVIDALENAING